jgi:hypothetical protein
MRVSMAAIIHRARWNFNVDEADGVSRRDKMEFLDRHTAENAPRRAMTGVPGSAGLLAELDYAA